MEDWLKKEVLPHALASQALIPPVCESMPQVEPQVEVVSKVCAHSMMIISIESNLLMQVQALEVELKKSQQSLVSACESILSMRGQILTLEKQLALSEGVCEQVELDNPIVSWCMTKWRTVAHASNILGVDNGKCTTSVSISPDQTIPNPLALIPNTPSDSFVSF